MSAWRKYFHANIAEVYTPPEFVYNADQTGLYYQKLPNRMCVDESNQKDYAGVKQMKYKTCTTLMVGTSSSGNVPLTIVGKPKHLEIFKLMDGARPPIPYKNQENDGFDQKITLWQMINAFWPYHLQTEGDVNAILFMDKC